MPDAQQADPRPDCSGTVWATAPGATNTEFQIADRDPAVAHHDLKQVAVVGARAGMGSGL
jgi:hypothetical protein